MPKVTIFIPISRPESLEVLFTSLEMLECDTASTNLLTYVDGDEQLYTKVRNMTQLSKFYERLCIARGVKDLATQHGIDNRKRRISTIKNESKEIIEGCDYVFGIEDDTIVPRNALAQLLIDYAAYPYAGFITGVELGRWGLPYVGAWRADDVYEPSKLTTAMPGQGIEAIDAGGFYCYLTTRAHYMGAEYKPFGQNVLGPDVSYGLYLRQQGYQNYVDWRVSCDHRTRGSGVISLRNVAPVQVSMEQTNQGWKRVIQ